MSSSASRFLKQMGWWIFLLVCAFYASYAFYMGLVEILVTVHGVVDGVVDGQR